MNKKGYMIAVSKMSISLLMAAHLILIWSFLAEGFPGFPICITLVYISPITINFVSFFCNLEYQEKHAAKTEFICTILSLLIAFLMEFFVYAIAGPHLYLDSFGQTMINIIFAGFFILAFLSIFLFVIEIIINNSKREKE